MIRAAPLRSLIGAPPARQRGFALLIVLWTLVFLAFLMTQIMASGRGAMDLAANLRDAASERAAADGAINATILQLLATGPTKWKLSGPAHVLVVGGDTVNVQLRTFSGMINPNLASEALLEGLLQAVAVPPGRVLPLADAIIGWRGTGHGHAHAVAPAVIAAYRQAGLAQAPAATPFTALGELNDVLGMTPKIYASLVPHLSLFAPGDPDPLAADPVVARALTFAKTANPDTTGYAGTPVADITACLPTGLCRHAVVSLPGVNKDQPFRILAMDDVR